MSSILSKVSEGAAAVAVEEEEDFVMAAAGLAWLRIKSARQKLEEKFFIIFTHSYQKVRYTTYYWSPGLATLQY